MINTKATIYFKSVLDHLPVSPVKDEASLPKANSKDKREENEGELTSQINQVALSRFEETVASHFIEWFPNEIQAHIFSFIEKEYLASCSLVCKQFNIIAKPLLAIYAIPSLSTKLMRLKTELNKIQTSVSDSTEKSDPLKISNKLLNRINSFKDYCNSLNDVITKHDEREKIENILKSTQILLNEHNKIMGTQIRNTLDTRIATSVSSNRGPSYHKKLPVLKRFFRFIMG